ncbi:hypothetical protein PVAG01_00166 [Phlyctema vagabunda]|uniref:EF-hand domain-containing protein n=1 Tax=Phlyctema vagabunda TaxID=108571 RepID=A0ABR4PTG8_9HELO
MHHGYIHTCLFLLHLLNFIGLATSEECGAGCEQGYPCPGRPITCYYGKCCDGSNEPTFGCCGVGACNVLCYNCDGGCLGGSDDCPSVCSNLLTGSYLHTQPELRSVSDDGDEKRKSGNKFDDADEDKDGKLSYLEWVTYTAGDRLVNLTEAKERWALFDKEGKGYLSKDEAYKRKA